MAMLAKRLSLEVIFIKIHFKKIFKFSILFAGGITIGGALVLQTDLTAFNGVVHAIDRVIEHEPPPTLGRLLSEDNRFSIFVRAATAAGLMSTLESGKSSTKMSKCRLIICGCCSRSAHRLRSKLSSFRKREGGLSGVTL